MLCTKPKGECVWCKLRRFFQTLAGTGIHNLDERLKELDERLEEYGEGLKKFEEQLKKFEEDLKEFERAVESRMGGLD